MGVVAEGKCGATHLAGVARGKAHGLAVAEPRKAVQQAAAAQQHALGPPRRVSVRQPQRAVARRGEHLTRGEQAITSSVETNRKRKRTLVKAACAIPLVSRLYEAAQKSGSAPQNTHLGGVCAAAAGQQVSAKNVVPVARLDGVHTHEAVAAVAHDSARVPELHLAQQEDSVIIRNELQLHLVFGRSLPITSSQWGSNRR